MKETTKVKIGDRVIIDDKEWKVAEIHQNDVTLYREGIDGISHTLHKSINEIELMISPIIEES